MNSNAPEVSLGHGPAVSMKLWNSSAGAVRDEDRVQRLRARRRGGSGLTSEIPRCERFLHGSRDRIAPRIRAADSSPWLGPTDTSLLSA
jgi:hypothetical protein